MPKKRTIPAPPQPTLFDLEQFSDIKCAIDPSWDECDRDRTAPEQCASVGDLIKINPQWMDKCAAAVRGSYRKSFRYKSDESDLICEVLLVDEPPGTCIYVMRGTWMMPIPHGNYSVLEQVSSDTYNIAKLDDTVLEQVNKSAPEQCHWVEEYKVVRYQQEHKYCRYVWMEGRKLHHVHIPGGNVKSPIARERKLAVENAIAAGRPPGEIEKIIKGRE